MQMSLRDKIKSKVKSKLEDEPKFVFDQTSFVVEPILTASQLKTITLSVNWHKHLANKNPKLRCRWFNKTQTNIEEIPGVNGDTYQPCLNDIGTTIRIQALPIADGLEYEGMPLILDVGPIKLDPETEEEANQLIAAGKATFFIQVIRCVGLDSFETEGLVKISGRTLEYLPRSEGAKHHQKVSIPIGDTYPELAVSRTNSKQMTIVFNSKGCAITFLLDDHQVRDLLCLVCRLLSEDDSGSKTVSESTEMGEKIDIIQTTPTKTKASSEQELPYLPDPPNSESAKKSATEMLSLAQLKKDIRKSEAQQTKLLKEIDALKNAVADQKMASSLVQERLFNIDRNYKAIEQQKAELLKEHQIQQQQLSYFKNQCKIKQQEVAALKLQLNAANEKSQNVSKKLDKYEGDSTSEAKPTYQQLNSQLLQLSKHSRQLQARLDYLKQEQSHKDENYQEMAARTEEMQAELTHMRKKYQSLSNQKVATTVKSPPATNVPQPSSQSHLYEVHIKRYETELIALKGQLREIVDQNNALRSLISKDVKNSSKTELRQEILQLKKISSKLSEAVAEKDLALEQMRHVNKDLTAQLYASKQH